LDRSTQHWGVDHPWIVAGLSLMVLLLLAAGASRLQFDPRYSTFFAEDDPQLRAFEHLRDVFAPSDSVVFIVDPGPRGAFSESGLRMLEQLTEAAWELPFTLRVDSPLNHPHSRADGDLVEIGPLVEDAAALDAEGRARVARIARTTPELAGRLVERDGPHVAVAVTVILEGDPLVATARLMTAARELARETEQRHPGVGIHLGGIVAMNHAFSESSLNDSAVLLPLMLALMIAGLIVLLNAALPVLAIVAVMLLSVAGALGAAGWAGMVLTTPAAIAPIIIITVAIADGVHLVLGQRLAGMDAPIEALRRSLDEQRRPILLTSLTTAAGFASMNFSAVPPFRDLGNLVAVGALLAGALSLTLLPALLRLLPHSSRAPRVPAAGLGRLADLLLRRRARVVLLLGLGALALVPGLAKLQVNDDFVAYFDEDLPFRQAAEIADEHLAGMYEIEYQLVAPESGGIHDPEWLAQVDAFTAWLRAQPETAHVLSWTDVLERLHRVMSDGGAEAGRLPPDAPTASQYTLLYELSLPLGLDLTNLIAQDYGSVRQLVTLRNMDSRRVLEFEERADAWLAEHAPDVGQRHGGINLMFAHISERNVAAMFEGNLLAVGVIALVLAAALRSLTLAAVSLVTNLVPVLGAFAIWGWLSGDLGLALSTAFGMTLGIVVDDTVHLLSRFQRSRAAGMSPAEAVRTAVTAVGPALVITTGILLLGFACLASSSFAINGLLARITMLTIGLALVFDLLLLPALLAGRQSGDRARVEG
jgi:predicted RND superfamily exporter protein